MTDFEFDMNTQQRQSYSLGLSVALHAFILFLMLFNFSWQTDEFEKNQPSVLMIDLSKVELGEKTNLPPEVKVKQKKKQTPTPQPKEKPKKVEQPKTKTPLVKQEKVVEKPKPVKPVEQSKPKDAVKVQQPKPKAKPKPKPKPTPKKAQPKPQPKVVQQPKKVSKPKNTQTDGLQSLLASVNTVRKPANPAPSKETQTSQTTGLEINDGIKGGTSGSRLEALTISEKDLISNKLRGCWNVNAGVEGAEEMIIELRAYVNRDGRIKDVRVLNMKNNPVFRSMADSAVRAVYVCDSLGNESPFKILSTKHSENYSSWKEIHLRMNPVDGGVF